MTCPDCQGGYCDPPPPDGICPDCGHDHELLECPQCHEQGQDSDVTAKIDTTLRQWCKNCEAATASIRIVISGARYHFVCAQCRNPWAEPTP